MGKKCFSIILGITIIIFITLLSLSAGKNCFTPNQAEREYIKHVLTKKREWKLLSEIAVIDKEKFCEVENGAKYAEICKYCISEHFTSNGRKVHFDSSRQKQLLKGCIKKNIYVTKRTGKVNRNLQKLFKVDFIKGQQVLPCPVYIQNDTTSPKKQYLMYFSNGPNTDKKNLSCFSYNDFSLAGVKKTSKKDENDRIFKISGLELRNSILVHSMLTKEIDGGCEKILGNKAFEKSKTFDKINSIWKKEKGVLLLKEKEEQLSASVEKGMSSNRHIEKIEISFGNDGNKEKHLLSEESKNQNKNLHSSANDGNSSIDGSDDEYFSCSEDSD